MLAGLSLAVLTVRNCKPSNIKPPHTMNVTHDPKTNKLTIVLDCPAAPKDAASLPLSPSGKTRSFVNTGGNKPTSVTIAGQPLIVGAMAYIKA